MNETPKRNARASATARWLACPGSLDLAAGLESADTKYTTEGTQAHAVCQAMLEEKPLPDCDADMAAGAEEYILAIAETLEGVDEWHPARLEQLLVDPDNIEVSGTPDLVLFYMEDGYAIVHIIDYKFGAGIAVSAVENPQLMTYAHLAWRHVDGAIPTKAAPLFRFTIIQPRSPNGDTRSDWACDADRIWDHELAIRDALNSNQLEMGDHCKWCPALKFCPEHRAVYHQVENNRGDCTLEHWAEVLAAAPRLRKYLDAIESELTERLADGKPVPGFKLVERRGRLDWSGDEGDILDALWQRLGGPGNADVLNSKLRTPTQVAAQYGDQVIDGLTERKPGTLKIVPVSHPGEPVITFPPVSKGN